jgi:hypothetical protein
MPSDAEHVRAWEAAVVLSSGNLDSQVHLTREGLFPPAPRTCHDRVAVGTLRRPTEVPIACAS